MKITSIKVSTLYKKSFRKIPHHIQNKAIQKIRIFEENPFNAQLKTHPLSGKEKGCWAFWIIYSYRIKFIFISYDKVLFLDIGTHAIYK